MSENLRDYVRKNYPANMEKRVMSTAQELWSARRALPPTEILPGLWMTGAGHLAEDIAEIDPQCVVTVCYGGDLHDDRLHVHWGFNDADVPDVHQLSTITALVQTLISQKQRVLVHCVVGANRSGLVCALVASQVLHITGREAVAHVRQKRPGSLTNPAFVAFLEGLR